MTDEQEQPPSGDVGEGFFEEKIDAVRESSRKRRIEFLAAALMALAVIGAAWASYESSRWGAVQTTNFVAANSARVDSMTLSTRAGQEAQVDVALFFQAVNAFAKDQEKLFTFYANRFRPEFSPAFDAWMAMDPANNPNAAKTPFELPEYALADFEDSDALVIAADTSTATAAVANQRSDNYILATVVYAAVLLFAGISSLFKSRWFRDGMVLVATVGFVANSLWVATMPVVLYV